MIIFFDILADSEFTSTRLFPIMIIIVIAVNYRREAVIDKMPSSEININEIINRIKAIKKANHLTNPQIAQKADIPVGTLNRILAGENKDVSITIIAKLSQALNTSIDYVAYGIHSPLSKASTADEHQLLMIYRELDSTEQQRLLEQAIILREYCRHKPENQ